MRDDYLNFDSEADNFVELNNNLFEENIDEITIIRDEIYDYLTIR